MKVLYWRRRIRSDWTSSALPFFFVLFWIIVRLVRTSTIGHGGMRTHDLDSNLPSTVFVVWLVVFFFFDGLFYFGTESFRKSSSDY